MGPYGSVGANIKTGRSPMAHDNFWTATDPKMAHKKLKKTQKNVLKSVPNQPRKPSLLSCPLAPTQTYRRRKQYCNAWEK